MTIDNGKNGCDFFPKVVVLCSSSSSSYFRLSLARLFIKFAAVSLTVLKSFLYLLAAGNYIGFTMLGNLLLSAYRLSSILFIAFFFNFLQYFDFPS